MSTCSPSAFPLAQEGKEERAERRRKRRSAKFASTSGHIGAPAPPKTSHGTNMTRPELVLLAALLWQCGHAQQRGERLSVCPSLRKSPFMTTSHEAF